MSDMGGKDLKFLQTAVILKNDKLDLYQSLTK
jgi:hypothetical protein